ncbi:MAG TPA: tetratricopeptide repeat protein [Candidatus Eisenbacteria bacterium]|nr:tetratricopeptide repeat protein [Candidatus Eisenbacteria bacterium]
MRAPRSLDAAGIAFARAAGLAPWLLLALGASGALYEWGGAAGRGMRQLKEKHPKEAVQSFREAERELPRSAAVRYDRALALGAAGQADSAREAYTEAFTSRDLRGNPARSAAAYNLGNESLRQGRYDEAAKLYRQSLTIDPNRADAKKNLEEAIRRGRNRPPQASSGGQGQGGSGSSGSGTSGQSPPGSQPNTPPPTKPPGSAPQPPGQMSGTIPNPSEAEHWLNALEEERKSARRQERAGSPQETKDKDW